MTFSAAFECVDFGIRLLLLVFFVVVQLIKKFFMELCMDRAAERRHLLAVDEKVRSNSRRLPELGGCNFEGIFVDMFH